MRIGEFAKLFDIKKSTVRYYTDMKLLLPVKTGHSFFYDEICVKDMKDIIELRNMGFSIEEVIKIKTYERLHINYSEDEKEVIKNIFHYKVNELNQEKVLIENKINSINRCKEEIMIEKVPKQIGISVEYLEFFTCPICKEELELIDGKIKNMSVFNGTLNCTCGYSVKIEEGILFASDRELVIPNDLKKQSESWQEKISKISPELMALIIENGVKMKSHKDFWKEGQIYLFSGADTDILSMRLNEEFRTNGLYIFACIYTDTLKDLKRKIEYLNIPGKFLFINHFDKIPLKSCVDRVVDNGSNIIELLTSQFDINTFMWILSVLQNNAEILSILPSIQEESKTFEKVPEYKFLLSHEFLKDKFSKMNLEVISQDELGKIENVSNLFPMINQEDYLKLTLYKLKRK
ncbi:MerR family transcriptional regulator [Oceanirhabdus sp. W0125-5]|uniref:MerR family transcriptional regulator n=1 Tax=Oceanirhabdus sp. W0125-5 TaxID=2999116 RepID=UPI0022F33A18|nr:MerR family transcriptional regulator [Oceanirhabdus sp. W0125-5]WBW96754.1 MerR family transcriptional regulator [Oceanirhabdus sp. W0125-5]